MVTKLRSENGRATKKHEHNDRGKEGDEGVAYQLEGAGFPVYLGEDVGDQKGEREREKSDREVNRSDVGDLGPHEVGDNQEGDEQG